MSRAAADAVALAADGADNCAVLIHRTLGLKSKFVPHRLRGLAARCLASSNAVYDKIDYCDGGSFAEVGASRHAIHKSRDCKNGED